MQLVYLPLSTYNMFNREGVELRMVVANMSDSSEFFAARRMVKRR